MGEIGFTPIQLGGTGRMKPSSEVPKPSKKQAGLFRRLFVLLPAPSRVSTPAAALGLARAEKRQACISRLTRIRTTSVLQFIDQETERIIRTIPRRTGSGYVQRLTGRGSDLTDC